MGCYDLNKLLINYKDISFRSEIPSDDFRYFIENHEKINRPDFIVVFDLKKRDPIIFRKNYHLKFDIDAKETPNEILSAVDPNPINEIFQVDQRCLEFGEKNIFIAEQALFQLRFTASLIKGHPRSFLRNISFINLKHSDTYQPILIVTITDVTDFVGMKNKAKINIRFTNDDEILCKKVQDLKNELNTILNPKLKATEREGQIILLVALGKTSEEIAKHFHISVNTVNTHRQNLIKKYKVKNTASLINILLD